MSQEFKYTSIILGKRDVGETDRLYILYTLEKGKVTILGKGVRKPNARLAGNLETVNLSEIFVFQGRGRGNITGAINLNSFSGIRSSEMLTKKVFEVFNLLEKSIQLEEKDENIFNLLIDYLEILEEKHKNISILQVEILQQGFIFKLLDLLGYKLEVTKCVVCNNILKLENNFFSFYQGGIICEECSKKESNKIIVSNNAIKILRIFSTNKLKSFLKIKAQEDDLQYLKNIVQGFLAWIK